MKRWRSCKEDKLERKTKWLRGWRQEDTDGHLEDNQWSGGRMLSLLLPLSFPYLPLFLLTSSSHHLLPPSSTSLHLKSFFLASNLSVHTQGGTAVPSEVVAIAQTVFLMFNSLLGSQGGQQEIKKRERRWRNDYHFFLLLLCSSHDSESEMKYMCGRERLRERQRQTDTQKKGTKLCG